MKRKMKVIGLMALWAIALTFVARAATAMDACMTGSWYDPDVAHEGLVVEVLPTQTVAYWYTFRFFDALEQNWLVFQGAPDALVAYDVLPFEGGSLLEEVGAGELLAVDDDHLIFAYDLSLNLDIAAPDVPTPWCLHVDCAAVQTLDRLTQPIPCEP